MNKFWNGGEKILGSGEGSQEQETKRETSRVDIGGYSRGMLGQRRTAGGGEKMAKKLNLGDSKLTFWKPNCQAMLLTEDKNLLEMVHMRREILGEEKDIVHLDKTEGKITQNLIHKVLKWFTSLPEAKRYAKKFEHPEGGDDGGLLNILRSNRPLIVPF